jgi:hypothetical protein
LECTSQTNPFGYQGTFTGNREALMITNTGAKVVRTTQYSADQNIQSRTVDVQMDLKGNATAKVRTTYTGIQYENDNLDGVLNHQSDDQKKWVLETTAIPSFDLVSFKMENRKSKIPTAVVNTDLSLQRLATVSGKRLFLTPNLLNKSTDIPEKVESRKSDVELRMPFIDYDTVVYHLPDGIYPEFTPETIKHTSRFGEYEAQFKIEQNKLTYIRRMKMKDGVYPKESYNELIEFKKNVNKADNIKVVFVNKT